MKKIFRSTLLLLCTAGLFAACDTDNEYNPTVTTPTEFKLNTPALAANGTYDLANSTQLEFTCSQPDYGFPAATKYVLSYSINADMSNATDVTTSYPATVMSVSASELAAGLTSQELAAGATEDQFPMDIPVYVQATATMQTAMGGDIEGTTIKSNIVKLNSVHLLYSLPPVTAPTDLYVTGAFSNWSWDSALQMIVVNGNVSEFWRLVYIDGEGIRFNSSRASDGNEVGFDGITLTALNGETDTYANCNDKIVAGSDGSIATTEPGWYLMVVNCSVEGRDIIYSTSFYPAKVWLIGPATAAADWSELEAAAQFTTPTTADGQFVSPTLPALAGTDDSCLRMYVKIPGQDWWKSEFIVGGTFGETLTYRGNGGDQTRVGCAAGQKVYLNFSNDTGEIK